MERNSRQDSKPNKKPTPTQIARRRATAAFIATAISLGGANFISKQLDSSRGATKAKTELVAKSSEKKAEQMAITIGPSGQFPNLLAAVLEIAGQNPKLNSEDIRQTLSDELKVQLVDLGVSIDEYNQFQPVEELSLSVPTDWGVGEPIQPYGGAIEAPNP